MIEYVYQEYSLHYLQSIFQEKEIARIIEKDNLTERFQRIIYCCDFFKKNNLSRSMLGWIVTDLVSAPIQLQKPEDE